MSRLFNLEASPFFPKSVLDLYQSQKDSDFEFQCKNGCIQLSHLPLLRTDFHRCQIEAKHGSALKQKITFNYEDFPLSTVKIFTDLLHDITQADLTLNEVLDLMKFLLVEEKCTDSQFESGLFQRCIKILTEKSFPDSKMNLMLIYIVSLEKQDNPVLEKLMKHFTTKTTKEKFQSHMSDINGGFNKTAKELQDFVLNQARIADRKKWLNQMMERVLQFFPKEIIAQPTETNINEHVQKDELFSFASQRFEAFNGVKQTDSNFELMLKKRPHYFAEWMHNDNFYELENGIHTMTIPKSGTYSFEMTGWGSEKGHTGSGGPIPGSKIQLQMELNKGEKIRFFIGGFRGGAFLFDGLKEELFAVAGSAGYSYDGNPKSSASLTTSNPYTKLFSKYVPDYAKGFEFQDILYENQIYQSFAGSGYQAGDRVEYVGGHCNFQGGTSFLANHDMGQITSYIGEPYIDIVYGTRAPDSPKLSARIDSKAKEMEAKSQKLKAEKAEAEKQAALAEKKIREEKAAKALAEKQKREQKLIEKANEKKRLEEEKRKLEIEKRKKEAEQKNQERLEREQKEAEKKRQEAEEKKHEELKKIEIKKKSEEDAKRKKQEEIEKMDEEEKQKKLQKLTDEKVLTQAKTEHKKAAKEKKIVEELDEQKKVVEEMLKKKKEEELKAAATKLAKDVEAEKAKEEEERRLEEVRLKKKFQEDQEKARKQEELNKLEHEKKAVEEEQCRQQEEKRKTEENNMKKKLEETMKRRKAMEEKEQKRANRRSSMIEFASTNRTDFLGQPKIIEEESVDEKPLVTEDPLYEFSSHTFDVISNVHRCELNIQQQLCSRSFYFKPWMKEKKFYNLENGIHTLTLPLTGQYELVLSGWGQGNSAGCKITMIKSFKQGETIKFFIGSFLGGVFVFDQAYQLISVAGSAGQSQDEKIRCSASFDKEKDSEYDKLFTISPPEEWKGFDFSDVIRGRDDKPWGGSGFQAGDKHDSALSFQGGSSMSTSSNSKFERVVGDPFFKVTFLSN